MALDKKTMAAIDNYGSQITSKKDFVDAVRSLPGMYIGHIGNNGFLTMIREIFQNSLDQLTLKVSPCDHIDVEYNEKTTRVTVSDNGLGIPFDDMIRIFTREHTSKNYDKKPYEYSSGLNGVGAKCVNALSSSFTVESYKYDGTAMRLDMEDGYPIKDPYPIPNNFNKQGTTLSFVPSTEVLGELSLPWEMVYRLVKKVFCLTDEIGSYVDFKATDYKGNIHEEHIVNKDGLVTELTTRVKSPIIKPIIIKADNGIMKLDTAICWDAGDDKGPDEVESFVAFSNFCPTTSGTHIQGTIDGIQRWFVSYMNNIYLANQKSKVKIKVNNNDIRNGLNLVISAAHLNPVFTGQAKENLDNEDFLGYAKQVVMKGLDDWSKMNPQDLSKLAKFFKDIAELRIKSDTAKAKIVTKYQSTVFGMPAKYTKPLKEERELFIVEGDSAAGGAKDARIKETQGVFPIRGKMPNAYQKSYNDFMNNAEVQAIIHIIFRKDYKRTLTVEDCRWDKIIVMSDGDVDGAHIQALLLRFFIRYMPQLLEAGKVYAAVPPLYSIPGSSKDKKTFFTNQIDYVRYNQKLFNQNHTLTYIGSNKTLTGKELTALFMTNVDYVYEINRVATTYALNPNLLEMVLLNYYNKNSISSLKKQIKSTYRFMDVTKKNGVDVVEGTIDKSYKLFITDKFINDCNTILDIIKDNASTVYLMDGVESSLYDIMSTYEAGAPNGLSRYKGLGEMDSKDLAISTMSPYGSRTLIRYTLEDAKEEAEAIRIYETDLSKLLTMVGKVSREDLLD